MSDGPSMDGGALRGCRDALVLDRAPSSGLGSTGRATGGFLPPVPVHHFLRC